MQILFKKSRRGYKSIYIYYKYKNLKLIYRNNNKIGQMARHLSTLLRQHIFDTPDTYVGGIESISVTQPILSISGNEKQIVHKEKIEIIPALLNIFNEHSCKCKGSNC